MRKFMTSENFHLNKIKFVHAWPLINRRNLSQELTEHVLIPNITSGIRNVKRKVQLKITRRFRLKSSLMSFISLFRYNHFGGAICGNFAIVSMRSEA